jgi:putative OPT family oligopeptide transporter
MAATAPQPPVKRKTDDAQTGVKPYVPDEANLPEFTWSAVIVGAVLGIVFGASSLYLVLKVGMTVSASIPVAVLSITLFRVFSKVFGLRPRTILENNIVQTTGSAGESIAFGVGVTMPALMLLGFEMDIGRVMLVSILGGTLGILMMIPLRRAFIVRQHGILKYPEGTACADVLIVGEQGGSSAKTVFVGFGLAAIYQFLWQGFKLWKEVPARGLSWFKGAEPAMEVNPALLGVGYIIGTKISCIMVAGGVLSAFVLIPAIRLFGDGLLTPLYPGTVPIAQMDTNDIWHDYVLYIGAGAVAAGGIISLFQAMPLIIGSIRSAFGEMRRSGDKGSGREKVPRTDRDLPIWVVGLGALVLVVAIWATTPLHNAFPWFPDLGMSVWGALLIVLFGFLFVTVSSRLTGEIGSSSNPISGMTVATLLLTCTIFLLMGKIQVQDQLTALSVAAVVCIAASNGGTTSQDLKTGYLVGATPKWQQWSIIAGTISSAMVIGVILVVLNRVSTVYSNKDLPRPRVPIDVAALTETGQAPDDKTVYHLWRAVEGNPQQVPQNDYLVDDQGRIRYLVDPGINGKINRRPDGTEVIKYHAPKAQLMAFITKGILNRNLPWSLVLLGVAIALVLELCGVPSLPFAVGVYLPLSSSTPIFVGGLVRYAADWRARRAAGDRVMSESESDMSPGVLLSTGYIAGGTIAAVVIAFMSFTDAIPKLLATWQYRTLAVTNEKPVDQLYHDIAKQELEGGIEPLDANQQRELATLENIMRRELARTASDPNDFHASPDQLLRLAEDEPRIARIAGVKPENADERDHLLRTAQIAALSSEIAALNNDQLPRYALVRKGMNLKVPGKDEPYVVAQDGMLGDVAREVVGSPEKAVLLRDLNEQQLPLPTAFPVGSKIKIPQHNWPALAAFAVLAVFLLVVGLGWFMNSPVAAPTMKTGKQNA